MNKVCKLKIITKFYDTMLLARFVKRVTIEQAYNTSLFTY